MVAQRKIIDLEADLKKAGMGFVVDQLGDLRARIKRMKDEAKDLEQIIKDRGLKVVDGFSFVATVIESERKITDWQKIATDLGATKRKIAANTRKFDVTAVKVTAHKK